MATDDPAGATGGLTALETYVSLPLSASALRKWSRFAGKGGIGSAVGTLDILAEPETGRLMFMEGENITVLMAMDDGQYLGYCEGCVGIFSDGDVRFTSKLKKPVFTKRPAAAVAVMEARIVQDNSIGGLAENGNYHGVTVHALTSGSTEGSQQESINGSPVPPQQEDISMSTASPHTCEKATMPDLPSRVEVANPVSASGGTLPPSSRPRSKRHGIASPNGAFFPIAQVQEDTTSVQERVEPELACHLQGSYSNVSRPEAPSDQYLMTTNGSEHSQITENWTQTPGEETQEFILDAYRYSGSYEGATGPTMMHAEKPRTLGHLSRRPSSPRSPASVSSSASSGSPSGKTQKRATLLQDDTPPGRCLYDRLKIIGQQAHDVDGGGRPDSLSATSGRTDNDSSPIKLAGGSVATLLRRRMEEHVTKSVTNDGQGETRGQQFLQEPLQILTRLAPSSQASSHSTPDLALSPSDDSSDASHPQPPLTPIVMPNLPKGISLKQLRATSPSTVAFPPARRSPSLPDISVHSQHPHPTSIASSPILPSAASTPASSDFRQQHFRIHPTYRGSPAWMIDTVPSPFSSPKQNGRGRYPVDLSRAPPPFPPSHPGSNGVPTSSEHMPRSPLLEEAQQYEQTPGTPLLPVHLLQQIPSPSLPSPQSCANPPLSGHSHGTENFVAAGNASPVRSNSSHSQSLKSEKSSKMRHSRSFSSMGLARTGSLLSKRRPSLPTGSSRLDGTKEAVVLGSTEFEFVTATPIKPTAARTVAEDFLKASSTSSIRVGSPHDSRRNVSGPDYETEDENGKYGNTLLVTRPSEAAKARVRSIYIDDQYVEPASDVDQYGFFTSMRPAGSDQVNPGILQDPKALEAHRARELKWVSVMNTSTAAAAKKNKKIKKLVSYGIPNSVRGKTWSYLAEVHRFKVDGLYHELLLRDDPECYPEIEKDLDRTFPDHAHFRGEHSTGRHDLSCVLRAFAHYSPDIGYCQGLCFIVATMLLHVEAESAFWLLIALLKNYLRGYYDPDMQGFVTDSFIFGRLLKSSEPKLHAKLAEAGLEASMFVSSWFLPLFTQALPWPSLLRVVDLMFYGEASSKFMLRVGLSIVDLLRDTLLASQDDLLPILLHPPPELVGPASLVPTVLTIKIPDRTLRKYAKLAEASLKKPSSKR